MRRSITRAAAAVTAGAAFSALGLAGMSTAGATQAPQQRTAAAHAAVVPGARLWVQRYSGGYSNDYATAVASSPDGSRVYVTGASAIADDMGYVTIGYNAATGTRLWAARYDGPYPGGGTDEAFAVAVSPDGSRVFVTGSSYGTTSRRDYATVAYNAATGAQLWAARYNGPGNRHDDATSLAVSPDDSTVYVTGRSDGKSSGTDYATIAYNAATGTQKWAARYGGNGDDGARSVAVSPDGGKVYVTGYSPGVTTRNDYATIAYRAATGARMWAARYNGPAGSWDSAAAVALSPDGRRVYVTGRSFGKGLGQDYATIAYNAVTGARMWAARYNGPGNDNDNATALAVSPAGTLLVTGASTGATSDLDYATIAYSPAGTRLWAVRYNDPANGGDSATSVAAPGNGKVYVTGTSRGQTFVQHDFATIAYNVFTGARMWIARYNGPNNASDWAASVAARTGRVFVTGASSYETYYSEYATVAYGG